ncbi:MAG TPA: hypothetical protein VFI65_08180 [Streptosporangiaceae bacterium]|nr:hypothetical protein [Streptosporangiaceae bacterium]
MPEDNWLNQPLGGPAYDPGTPQYYERINRESRNEVEAKRSFEDSERLRIASMGPSARYGGGVGAGRSTGPPRKLLSKALLITIPIGALLYFFPKNGKDVQIPEVIHLLLAVVVASLGSPKLRPLAIGLVILAVIFVVVVTLWTNHVLLNH